MANSEKSNEDDQKRWGDLLPVVTKAKDGTERGRPTAITPRVLDRLREAFVLGCDDEEACLNAEISTSTLYDYQKANVHFLEWKEALKRTPFLKARKTIVEHLERDPEFALKYMERKKKAEFAPTGRVVIEDERSEPLDEESSNLLGEILTEHMKHLQDAKQPPSEIN